ncbi:MAG: NADH-quinone oxidoreductase subunit N, partial [Pseudonocardia sp.]
MTALTVLAQAAPLAPIAVPPIDYAAIAPLLVILGAACASVLVEAFLPRHQRWPAQVARSVGAFAVAG